MLEPFVLPPLTKSVERCCVRDRLRMEGDHVPEEQSSNAIDDAVRMSI